MMCVSLRFNSNRRNETKWNEMDRSDCTHTALSTGVECKKRRKENKDKRNQSTHTRATTIAITTSTYPFPFSSYFIFIHRVCMVVCKWAGCLFIDLSLILYCILDSSHLMCCRYAMHIQIHRIKMAHLLHFMMDEIQFQNGFWSFSNFIHFVLYSVRSVRWHPKNMHVLVMRFIDLRADRL